MHTSTIGLWEERPETTSNVLLYVQALYAISVACAIHEYEFVSKCALVLIWTISQMRSLSVAPLAIVT